MFKMVNTTLKVLMRHKAMMHNVRVLEKCCEGDMGSDGSDRKRSEDYSVANNWIWNNEEHLTTLI